jgi:hypothetical protein
LIEVNAHSLFSKWFSESGKLVSRLFAKIQVGTRATRRAAMHDPPRQGCCCCVRRYQGWHGAGLLFHLVLGFLSTLCLRAVAVVQEVVDEPDSLVFVLIDEVESLTAARCAAGCSSAALRQLQAKALMLLPMPRLCYPGFALPCQRLSCAPGVLLPQKGSRKRL